MYLSTDSMTMLYILKVVEFPQLINFPVSITVESPENYTFALFGKDSEIGLDEEPLFYANFNDPGKNPETEIQLKQSPSL